MEGSSSGGMVNNSGQIESTSDRENSNVVVDSIKYKGVRKRKWGKWVSEIRLPNSRERIWLGSYDSPVKAARAFDAAQFCLRGKSANFNFPHNPPEIPGGRSMNPAEIQAAASRFANMPVEPDREMIELPQITTTTTTNTTAEDESTSYSPSISDGATVQMDSDLGGVETSFYDQLTLSTTMASENFASDFGFLPGLDDLTSGNFYSPHPDNSFDYYNWTTVGGAGTEDHYDASFFQDCTSLWNFQI